MITMHNNMSNKPTKIRKHKVKTLTHDTLTFNMVPPMEIWYTST